MSVAKPVRALDRAPRPGDSDASCAAFESTRPKPSVSGCRARIVRNPLASIAREIRADRVAGGHQG